MHASLLTGTPLVADAGTPALLHHLLVHTEFGSASVSYALIGRSTMLAKAGPPGLYGDATLGIGVYDRPDDTRAGAPNWLPSKSSSPRS